MIRLPHPDDKPSPSRYPLSGFIPPSSEPPAWLEEQIRNADSWTQDWELNELNIETVARQSDHRKYIIALHNVCQNYYVRALNKFPLGIARWLAKEAENVCRGLPSQVLKSPDEGTRTANFAHENQFALLRNEWEAQNRNPALILQTLARARELKVIPPNWVVDLLVEAGSKVYESDGNICFDEALGLTPKKIKEARSAHKKVWIAELVAEAVDAKLSPTEARELAIFEAELVYGWSQYAPSTVQKYYETHADERNGFERSFFYSFDWYGSDSDDVRHSIRLPYWRRKVLKVRLEAYREAIELHPDSDDHQLIRVQRLSHIVSQTIAALRRRSPPKNTDADFIKTDYP